MLLALGIVLFVLLVIVHEYGHFIAARKNGVEVKEFGLGFPPRAKVLTKKNGTLYSLNWLPIGGFVKLKGEYDAARGPGTFGGSSFGKKVLIIAAGVLMNWLAAAVIFTILAFVGMPQLVNNQFYVAADSKLVRQEVFAGRVEPQSPANQLGLQVGDRIIRINEVPITSAERLRDTTQRLAGEVVMVDYSSQDNQSRTGEVRLRDDPAAGNFGVAPGETSLRRATWSAPLVGIGTTIQFTVETLRGLGNVIGSLLTGQGNQASQSVTGPVGIVVTLKELADQGWLFVLFLIGIISVSLAVMNSLPIPALDGGRLFVMALFRLLRKPLSKEREEKIHGTGMLVLLGLIVLITIVDVRRFF